MIIKEPKSWNEVVAILEEIQNEFGFDQLGQSNTILYRGQKDFDWELETTLERKIKAMGSNKKINVAQYLTMAMDSVEEINVFTGRQWKSKSYSEITEELKKSSNPGLPSYNYLVYLRHNGFPSPLLDWTKSPFIASYFAYSSAVHQADDSALFCYIPTSSGIRGGNVEAPRIHNYGSYVETHKRHFLQQAQYTICTQREEQLDKHIFLPHSMAFKESESNPEQDIIFKIRLPNSMRKEVLSSLEKHNLNEYSLFLTEDSFIRKIEMKHFDIEDYMKLYESSETKLPRQSETK